MALFRWRRWWAATGLPALRLMAVEYWRGKGPDEIAHYLGEVRTKAMRLEESEEADESFADRVAAWYAVERPDA